MLCFQNLGFHKVCGGRVLDLFHSYELEALVVGTQKYDWEEFEKQADYKVGYSLQQFSNFKIKAQDFHLKKTLTKFVLILNFMF